MKIKGINFVRFSVFIYVRSLYPIRIINIIVKLFILSEREASTASSFPFIILPTLHWHSTSTTSSSSSPSPSSSASFSSYRNFYIPLNCWIIKTWDHFLKKTHTHGRRRTFKMYSHLIHRSRSIWTAASYTLIILNIITTHNNWI